MLKATADANGGPVLFCWTCEWRLRVDFEAMGFLTEDSFLSKAQMWVCVDHEVSTHKHNRLKHIYISETLNELNLCEFYWGIVFCRKDRLKLNSFTGVVWRFQLVFKLI